ncbi:hypothetical protein CFOL_v3_34357 [Cephalotus follicularis]|uniref:Epidermal patterning factor-like protein n=1 Tax=Cephalotus follicularis TaxID=3775 RepID=A0A1Q3DEQ4_CEPFO|nr:hypothetical protein CFOL_v3_34357 [Cephalotus follicularis]
MGSCGYYSSIFCHRYISYLNRFFLFLLILSATHLRIFKVEGRANSKSVRVSQTVNEDKVIVRSQIGSRPPRCESRCTSCGHCEAIQVPADPRVKHANRNSSSVTTIAYARDGSSNYKPMSWKCKCGNLIFNP